MRKPLIPFEWKFIFCIHKNYFDKGYGLLNYLKYPLILFGGYDIFVNQRMNYAIWGSFLFFILSYVIGYYWIKTDMLKAEIEVNNYYNLFVEEVRKSLKK